MRLLVFSHRLDYTGAPLMLFRLVRRLAERHEVTLLLPSRPLAPTETLLEAYRELGIECMESVRLSRYDAALANTLVAADLVGDLLGRIPILWWIHEPASAQHYIDDGKCPPHLFGAVDRIVFPTRWQAEQVFRPYLVRDNWAIVPYAIGTPRHVGPAPFEAPPGTMTLVHLGTISRRKGQDLSVLALERLDNPDIRLVLMGSLDEVPAFVGALHDRVAASSRLSAAVTVMPQQPAELAMAWLAHADAVLVPTRDDLITLVILEALLHRRCVIASDFGPIPELIVHGETGLLSRTGQVAPLAENIDRAFRDPALRARLGATGEARVLRDHDFDAHVARMEAELTRVARRR